MRKEVKLVLLELQQKKLKEDSLAYHIIRKLICFQGRLSDLNLEFLTAPLSVVEEESIQQTQVPEHFVDARVCSVKFKNFRAFPDEQYGVMFSQDRDGHAEAHSLFLVGANSNGKSTICDALEYAYTGDVASVHRLTGVDLKKFLTFGFETGKVKKEDVRLTLTTMYMNVPTTISLTAPVEPLCTASFFCSDNDVEELERDKEQIEGYLLKQLGYGELSELKDKLDTIVQEIIESISKVNTSVLSATDIRRIIKAYLTVQNTESKVRDIARMSRPEIFKKLVDDIRSTNAGIGKHIGNKERVEEIKKSLRRIPKDYFEEEWNQLISNIILDGLSPAKGVAKKRSSRFNPPGHDLVKEAEEKKNTLLDTLQTKLFQMYHELYLALVNREEQVGLEALYEKLRKAGESYGGIAGPTVKAEDKDMFLKYINSLQHLSEELARQIELIKERFYKDHKDYLASTMSSFSPSSEQFILEYRTGQISAKIMSTVNGGFSGTPKEYYNTFRFKLYVIALKISLAFLYMRTSKIVVPIVIDDVFNATDFDNSIKLERFVYHIYKTYEEKVGSGIPLQLIVLSHDEMVMTAFRKGAKLINEQEISLGTKVSRRIAGNDFICGRLFHYTKASEIRKHFRPTEDFDNLYMQI